MAKGKDAGPAVSTPAETPKQEETAHPADLGALLYRDRATEPRNNAVTEGAANFATQTAEAEKSVASLTPDVPEAA